MIRRTISKRTRMRRAFADIGVLAILSGIIALATIGEHLLHN